MPRNGSGGYQAPANSWNPAINGAAATPADWQAVLDDIVSAIQGSLAADGQTPLAGTLKLNNQRITSVGAPTVAGDALRRQQVTKGANIASASTITIPAEGSLFDVTGTTTVTQINDTFPGRSVLLRFTDAVTLTHSANIVLPAGKDETTVAGDVVNFVNVSAGVWVAASWPALEQRKGGQLIGVRRFSASGTYTPTPGMKKVVVCANGAGGGGGGASGTGSGASAGGGGGQGATVWALLTAAQIGASQAVTIGAGGTAGAAAAGAGGTGGNTTLGSLLSAGGGQGGGGTDRTTSVSRGGVGGVGGVGSIATGTTIQLIGGASGGTGLRFNDNGLSGMGGGGTPSVTEGSTGTTATTPGFGGSGGCENSTTSRAGGAGAAGLMIVWEYA